jgi:hypothetical protein
LAKLGKLDKLDEDMQAVKVNVGRLNTSMGHVLERQARPVIEGMFGWEYAQQFQAMSLEDIVSLLPQNLVAGEQKVCQISPASESCAHTSGVACNSRLNNNLVCRPAQTMS